MAESWFIASRTQALPFFQMMIIGCPLTFLRQGIFFSIDLYVGGGGSFFFFFCFLFLFFFQYVFKTSG